MSIRSARYNLLSLRNPKGLTVIPEERDAWAFLDAAAITSSREQRAVIDLVRGLKNAQLWSKMKAIYPFVGGTATTHKFNLKDPRDADAAFRLTFSGGWTHASTGALGNASNTYADTFITPTSNLTENSTAYTLYVRNNTDGVYFDGGIGSAPDYFSLAVRLSNTLYSDQYYRPNSGSVGTNRITGTVTDSAAFFVSTRTDSTTFKVFRNTTQIGSTNTNSSQGWSSLSQSFLIAALRDSSSPNYYTNREYAFATLGDGLTDTDATALYNIVQRYQTSLGRQV